MRISVIGHSDSTGMLLPRGTVTWPELVRDQVAVATHSEVQLDSWRWGPYRHGAVQFALSLVDGAQPDLVILPLATYWCGYTNVRTKLQKRFGDGSGAWWKRSERFVADHVEGRLIPKSVTRKLARRVLGVTPMMSVQQFIDVHVELIHELARRENLQALVLADHHFSAENRRLMPTIPKAIAAVNAAVRPVVLDHRMFWDDMELAISQGGRREEIMLSDGVHMKEEAHQRLAKVVGPLAVAFARTLGEGRDASTAALA